MALLAKRLLVRFYFYLLNCGDKDYFKKKIQTVPLCPKGGEVAIHKLYKKHHCVKAVVDNEGELSPPPSTGIDILIAKHKKVKS